MTKKKGKDTEIQAGGMEEAKELAKRGGKDRTESRGRQRGGKQRIQRNKKDNRKT